MRPPSTHLGALPVIAALVATLATAPALAQAPACVDALKRGEDVPCQLVLKPGARAPFRGVLLSPAQSKKVQADIATLETAYAEQQALTATARAERDAAREESRAVVSDLLRTGQRLERANADLIESSKTLDASNRALSEAVEKMPTRGTLILTASLIAVAAFAGGYGLAKILN